MKISVLGDIIDTKDIYMITSIVGDEYFKTSIIKTVSGAPSEKYKHLNHSGFEFNIKFFNKKTLTIQLDGSDMWRDWNWYEMDYSDRIKLVEHQITNIRDVMISYWNKDKTKIPRIDFTFKKE